MKNSIVANVGIVSIIFFLELFTLSCNHERLKDITNPALPPQQSKTVSLKSLKINSNPIEIKDEMDLGKTTLDRVKIEYLASPREAQVTFNPELEEKTHGSGIWNIGVDAGKKTLTVTIKKDSEQHVYTLSIEKQSKDALKIAKINCDAQEISENIFSIISFKDVKKSFVELKVEPSDSSATVEFSGFGEKVDEKTWKWLLANGDNSLKIKLKKGEEEIEYTAKIKSKLLAVSGGAQLNGIQMYNIPDEFEVRVLARENPTFDAKCNSLLLGLMTASSIKEVVMFVDGIKDDFESPTSQGNLFKSSEKLYMLEEKEKQFEMFLIPDDSLLSKNSCQYLKFKVKGSSNKIKLEPELSINDNSELPKDLLDNLEKDESQAPLYKMFKGPANLALTVSSYEKAKLIKEVKINGSPIPFPARSNIIKHEVQIEDATPTKIKIEFIPKNENIVEVLTWNFALQLGGEKPAIFGINLESINDVGSLDGELPESLTQHIKDGSNPLYKYNGTTATVVFNVEAKELVQDALFKMDGDAGKTIQPVTEGRLTYFAHTYKITDLAEHNIEVIFHSAKTDDYVDLTTKFRLQRTGNKIKIPARPYSFMINNLPSSKMPKDVREHLTDGSAPLYELDGFDILANVATFDESIANMIKHIRFTFEGENTTEVQFKKMPAGFFDSWQASSPFTMLEAKKPYLLKVELIPNDEALYEPLVYALKVQSSGVAVDMPLTFGIDMKPQKNGAQIKVNAENAIVLVQSSSNIMKSVTIEVKGVDSAPESCEIKELKNTEGVSFWQATRNINLVDGSETPERTIVITVKPQDEKKYNVATCTYKITGTKIEKNNAKFVIENKRPKVYAQVEFKQDAQGEYLDDYGATSITFTGVYTESAKASVRYAILNTKNEMIDFPEGNTPTEKYKVMQNKDGVHTTEKIKLFGDKPTTLKVWVVAEDGSTDDTYGLYIIDLNPISLAWSYEAKTTNSKFEDFENKDYDSVTLKKSQIKDADKNIYIAVRVWDSESGGFKIKDSEGQGNFEMLNQTDAEKKALKQTYMLKFDVSKLKDGSTNELTFKCNMWDKELKKDCFTYVVKITAKD